VNKLKLQNLSPIGFFHSHFENYIKKWRGFIFLHKKICAMWDEQIKWLNPR
jgi:hypothetical protein